jgi:hypothetical protein
MASWTPVQDSLSFATVVVLVFMLQVLCTTSTLAMGVNLPAHLVVLKGTVRWVGDSEVLPGQQSGYQEYLQTEVRESPPAYRFC